jgi:hypothetical protein
MTSACVQNPDIEFGVSQSAIQAGPSGGSWTVEVTSSGRWVAMTESPWITVSPANGNSSQTCTVTVDSTIVFEQRTGAVRIQSLDDSDEKKDFEIIQEGFQYQIALDDTERKIDEYADFDSRHFQVEVMSNVDFDVVIPESATWLTYKKSDLVLDRGSRPRRSLVRFDWKVNSRDQERLADITFRPKENVQVSRHDALKVTQKAALPIPAGTPEGDSLALLAVSRALNMYIEWDTAERMEHWNNVKVWKDGPDKGRVKYVQFFMFNTKEPIPYEIQYLTAAEEIVIFSNANQFMKSLDTGEYITKLTNLKRLTIGAYGLTSLHPDFVNMKGLEYLDLSSNCFQTVPDILTPQNFPNLHSLQLNACQRYAIYDLSNDIRDNIGGFVEDDLATSDGMESFKRLLKWNNLDTLRLSVNYLQGELPDMKDEGLPEWTFEELKDSLSTGIAALPEALVGLPKVLPDTRFFAINFNRFTGNAPDWLLYHPNLDLWYPFSLIFSQEGKSKDGKNARFQNEPTSLDYYYRIYENKKYNPSKIEE